MVKDKVRDPSAWYSWRYPQANTMSSAEKQEIMCANGNLWGQNCSALRKNWLSIKIARRKGEEDLMLQAMENINSIQDSMGIQKTYFVELQ